MKKIVRLTEGDVENIIKRIITERLGVPENISETAEKIVNKIYNEFIRDNEPYDFGETPDPIQIFDDFKVGDYEFDEIIISIIPHKNYHAEGKPVISSFQLATKTKINNYRIEKDDEGKLRINIVIVTSDRWTVSDVGKILFEDKNKIISSFSHELHHSYVAYKTPSDSPIKNTEYTAIQNVHFESIEPMYRFLYYLYYGHAIEEIVRPSEVYSSMRTQNITKSQFRDFFKNNKVIKTLTEIRDFRLDTMIKDLYKYIPRIDQFFNNVESDKNFPIKIPMRGNTEEEKIYTFLYVVYKLIIFSKIYTYEDFLSRTVNAIDPLALFLGEKGLDVQSLQNMMQSVNKKNEMLQKYTNNVNKVKNYRYFFGNEIKKLNLAADKTIKKLSKLYDMAKEDEKTSSIVDWDLHHDINKTAEKTIQEVKKLFREGKLKILPPTESDLKYIRDKKSSK